MASEELVIDWAPIQPEGEKPTPRGGHTTVAVDSNLVVFGGTAYGGEGKFLYFNDVHIFDADTGMWHAIRCKGELPEPRFGHSATLVGNQMFVFGGKGEGGKLFRDVFFLDLVSWSWVPVSSASVGPSPRLNHASCLVGRKIVVHGGWNGGMKCLADLWVFDTEAFTWMNPKTTGIPPSPRYGHTLHFMDNDGRIILFGGVTVKDGEIPAYQGDLRQLETETMVWSKPSVSADEYPSARYGHSFSKLGSQLLLFGGWGNGGLQSRAENKKPGAESFFAYDPESSHWWIPQKPDAELEHKYGHTATVMGDSLFIFGGWSGKQSSNSLVQMVLRPLG
mmetsp:Transcript_60187/g.136076  ORF Transcript_60187/g.136076 Transcript_60187/m.136076 type:complete len:335 (+) Transcript_60187:36-1040(+)